MGLENDNDGPRRILTLRTPVCAFAKIDEDKMPKIVINFLISVDL